MSAEEFALLVIGGGPSGLAAARSYREDGGDGPVAIVAAEKRRQVTLSGGRTLRYSSCVLATGAELKRLPVAGSDDPAVRVVRSLDDVGELEVRLRSVSHAIVIGSGFIGCEIAASLRRRGHEVTLISDERAPNCARLGEEAGRELTGWLRDEDVTLHLGAPVDGTAVDLRDGAIPVTSAMRTVLPGVLAVGDVCLAHNDAAGRPLRVEHWGDALGQGAIAGQTAAGHTATWSDVPGFWSTIRRRTLKYAPWGDGYDDARFERGDDGGFTAWYGRRGRVVGVLAHERDGSYECGRTLIAEGAEWR
jgi:3-phenylpropionate/trans-cinnamate dioxygenase ferredoxin reductase subunit